MPQPMTPAPSAKEGLLELADLLRRGAKAVVPAPLPGRGFGDMIIAGMRSAAPGGGSFQEELKKYAQDPMWGDDSVVDDPGLKERDVMAMSGMAAPIVGHASPHRWTGRPKWEAKGSGQGAATWGEAAAYASVPENFGGAAAPAAVYGKLDPALPAGLTKDDILGAWESPLRKPLEEKGITQEIVDALRRHPSRGIDAAYRRSLAGDAPEVHFSLPPDTRLVGEWKNMRGQLGPYLREDLEDIARRMSRGSGLDITDPESTKRLLESLEIHKRMKFQARYRDWQKASTPNALGYYRNLARTALDELRAARGLTGIELKEPGSFHVWDLPDDAKIINQFDLLKQHPELLDAYHAALPNADRSQLGLDQLRRLTGIGVENFPESGPSAFRVKDIISQPLAYGTDSDVHSRAVASALRDLGYDATKYYGEQNFTFGGSNPVQNYTILNPDKIEPLGTFNTALDFWKSPLAEELWPQIQKEMAERLRERKLLFGPGAK